MKPLVIGISGASGIPYGIRMLERLKALDVETHLIMTKSAELTLSQESGMTSAEVKDLASHCYNPNNIGAAPASGSFSTMGMIIAPCSIKSMSEISTGVTSNLLTRAADVTLKEKRRLVLMVRETPLHTGHLRTMTQLSEIGAIIAPPVPAFYTRPESIDDMILQTNARVLDLFDINDPASRRWDGLQ